MKTKKAINPIINIKVEVKEFIYNGVKIIMRLDYINHTASLIDLYDGVDNNGFVRFENMDGWLNILEAMKKAVEECKRLLEHDLAEASKFLGNKVIEN